MLQHLVRVTEIGRLHVAFDLPVGQTIKQTGVQIPQQRIHVRMFTAQFRCSYASVQWVCTIKYRAAGWAERGDPAKVPSGNAERPVALRSWGFVPRRVHCFGLPALWQESWQEDSERSTPVADLPWLTLVQS